MPIGEEFNMAEIKKFAIVMAGGSSPMLWPRSVEQTPKQFLHFIGNGTLLQNTIERLLEIFPIEDIYVITTQKFTDIVSQQIPELPKTNIIGEPFPRHTMPCVALALTQLSLKYPDDSVAVVFPADHHISNLGEFNNRIETAIEFAIERNAIVAIGITPTRPETNYGYIQVDNNPGNLGKFYDKGIRFTKTFAEKPDLETAKRFLSTDEFLWNTGIYAWKVSTFWESLHLCSPETHNYFTILKKLLGKSNFQQAVDETYRQIQSESLDIGILERARNVFVLESAFTWSDVGTWDEIYRLSLKDADNNCIVGDVLTIDTRNSFIRSHEKTIATIEVDDLVVVDTPIALLICRRGATNRVVEIVNYLRRKNASPLL
jgi:mannose-1-phosphate guanylyltransferase